MALERTRFWIPRSKLRGSSFCQHALALSEAEEAQVYVFGLLPALEKDGAGAAALQMLDAVGMEVLQGVLESGAGGKSAGR